MEKIKLPRTGDRPVEFLGRLIAEASSQQREGNGPCKNRYHELALYGTESGKYVIAIGYRTHWQGELPEDEVFVEDSIASAVETLRTTIPELPLYGFPPGQHYDERRAHVMGAVRKCYEHAVGKLLANVKPEQL